MDYLLKILVYVHMRKEGDNPCGFFITDTDFCIYVRGTDFFVYVEGRMVGNTHCGLFVTDTEFFVNLHTDLLIHSILSLWFLVFTETICLTLIS